MNANLSSVPALVRFCGGGHGNPLRYSCLENPMDRGAWGTTVHRVAKSRTQLNDFTHSLTQQRRNWGLERGSNLPEMTQLIRGRGMI